MTVTLVTGGSGFIGQHLVKALLERGDQVRIFDLRAPSLGKTNNLKFHQGDLADRAALSRAMAGARQVYHLAADPNLWAADSSGFQRTNVQGTLNVLAAAERHAPEKLVYTSTESILAGRRRGAGQHRMIDEGAEPRVEDMPGPYCRSKFLAEKEALAAARRGLPVVVVNPTLPIGPGDRRLTPPSRMLCDFLNGRAPAYLEAEINMIDVRDAALGHLLAAEHGTVGKRYILGGENLTMSRMLAILEELTGLPMPKRRIPYWLAFAYAAADQFLADHITHRPPRAPLAGVQLVKSPMNFDNTRALEELGLRPRPIRQALADAIDWFHSEGMIRERASESPRWRGSATRSLAGE